MTAAAGADLLVSIVTHDSADVLAECLGALAAACAGIETRLVIVDNASADRSADVARGAWPRAHVIRNERNVGFAAAHNQALRACRSSYWLLLNPDAVLAPDAVGRLLAHLAARPRAAAAGPRLVDERGVHVRTAAPTPCWWRRGLELCPGVNRLPPALGDALLGPGPRRATPVPVSWVWGTALLVSRRAIADAGSLSEDYFLYGEDLDWCLRFRRRGWEVWYVPAAGAMHYGGRSARRVWNDDEREWLTRSQLHRAVAVNRGRVAASLLRAVDGLGFHARRLRRRAGRN